MLQGGGIGKGTDSLTQGRGQQSLSQQITQTHLKKKERREKRKTRHMRETKVKREGEATTFMSFKKKKKRGGETKVTTQISYWDAPTRGSRSNRGVPEMDNNGKKKTTKKQTGYVSLLP